MKRTAFLQACLIFALLVASWVLLLVKFNHPQKDGPEVGEKAMATQTPGASQGRPEEKPTELPDESVTTQEATVPEGWQEWTAYLDTVGSPAEMRLALEELRRSLLSLPNEEAVRRILEFLESGADRRTGLAFQPGPENRLRGARSLRALLLDWLHELDPVQAAEVASRELSIQGTNLVPDVYVIHLRNYALGSTDPDAAVQANLQNYFNGLITHESWLENPTTAIAEAMDVAVYLESAESVPHLTAFMEGGAPSLLRRASSLALERLVDRNPLEVLPAILDGTSKGYLPNKSRAGYFARLDPSLPGAQEILDSYLKNPSVDEAEAHFFLHSFPNLNQSYSYNLISTNIPITEPGGYIYRLEDALEQVQRWQRDPSLQELGPTLEEVEVRIREQLSPNP